MSMTLTDVRNAVPAMTDGMLVELYCQYSTFADRNPDSDEGRYKAKMEIVDAESKKRHRPHVDAKKATKWGYWK
jgi:hypothetical protein